MVFLCVCGEIELAYSEYVTFACAAEVLTVES